jgi:YidC/Oxa1 family membrane protein insertase
VQKLMLYVIPIMTLGSGLFFPLGVLLYWFTSNTWTMGQQFYINKFHPHPDKDKSAPVAGELGKTLAPKPGQRPNAKAKSTAPAKTTTTEADESPAAPPPPPARNAPRPGQRPRQSGNRPAAKRPSQAKKRR